MARRRRRAHYRRPSVHRVRPNNPNTRIRPVRPYWSRSKIVRLVIGILLVAGLAGTAWLPRSGELIIELDPSGPYRVRSTTGPIEVVTGDGPEVRFQRSWLVRGPDVTEGSGEVLLDCGTRWPCRGWAEVVLPAVDEAALQTGAPVLELAGSEDLVVTEFAGHLRATASGDGEVILGPLVGRLTALTETGGVVGYGLRTAEVEVTSAAGPVELGFSVRPRLVSINAGTEPVAITLPPGDYAVTVTGASSIAINVGQAADADSTIIVHARGPVRIDPSS